MNIRFCQLLTNLFFSLTKDGDEEITNPTVVFVHTDYKAISKLFMLLFEYTESPIS